jgi:hypothetical protein
LSNGSSLNNNAGGELDYMKKMRGDDPAHGIGNHSSSSNVGPDQGVEELLDFLSLFCTVLTYFFSILFQALQPHCLMAAA